MFSRTRLKRKNNNFTKIFILSFIFIILLILLISIITYLCNRFKIKQDFEKSIISLSNQNEKEIFSLEKVFLYSSANAVNNESLRNLWNLNIYQFTDIAIYVKNDNINLTDKNTVKKLYIDNIKYNTVPEKGTPLLYYKNINNFGLSSLDESKLINDKLDFNILESDNSTFDTSNPNFYTSCQTPITLEFINKDIKINAIIPNSDNSLVFDNTLLQKANISLTSIACSFSFNINIVNNLNEKFVYNMTINIPLKDDETDISLYNKPIQKEITDFSNSKFLKTEENFNE